MAFDEDWQSTKNTILERNSHMFNNPEFSDISFTCEGSMKQFHAHKYVLATSSVVFKAMFYGDMAEKNSLVHLTDTDDKSLEEFLRFLYTDECELTPDNVVSVMYLAKKYIVPSLSGKCVDSLRSFMTAENAMSILEAATKFDEKELVKNCLELIESNTRNVITSKDFKSISQTTLTTLLKLDHMNVSEVELFRAVLRWSDSQCSKKGMKPTRENKRSVIGDAIYHLRFLAMPRNDFTHNVAESGLLTNEEIIPIYNAFDGVKSPDLKWTISEKRVNRTASRADTEQQAALPLFDSDLENSQEDRLRRLTSFGLYPSFWGRSSLF